MSFDTVVMIWILSVIILLKAAGLCKTSSLSFSEKQKLINTIMLTGSRFEYFKGTFICRSDTYGGNSIYNNTLKTVLEAKKYLSVLKFKADMSLIDKAWNQYLDTQQSKLEFTET